MVYKETRASEPISGPFSWWSQEIKAKLTQTGHLKGVLCVESRSESKTSQSPSNIVPDKPGLWPQTNLGSNPSPVLSSYELSSILTSFPPLRRFNFLLKKKNKTRGTSLVVRWLRIHSPSNAGDSGSIPGRGTKILCVTGQLSESTAMKIPRAATTA